MLLKAFRLHNILEKKRIIIPAGILIVALLVVSLWAGVLLSSNKIYKGAFIENFNVSGLTLEQAEVMLERHLKALYGNEVFTLRYADNVWPVSMDDIGFYFLYEEALKEAYSMGRSGNVFKRLYSILDLGIKEANFSVRAFYDIKRLSFILESIKGQIDRNPQNAAVVYKGGEININNEVMGRLLDIEDCIKVIENEINMRNFKNIDLVVEDVRPPIAYDDIQDITSILASAVTTFNSKDANRTANIKLACEKIDGTILLPGETFSMNKALGPRTTENGYKDAKIIYKNEFIEGPGGGVCQVTTTLYGSVLKARTQVVERMHHSLPLTYVEPGQDATIAENYIDFKFKNNKDYPVSISAEVVGNNLHTRILGKKENEDYTVKIKSMVVEEYTLVDEEVIVDNTIPDNEKKVVREPTKGIRVIVYREVYNKAGELIEKEKISDDEYKPVRAQVKVNQNYYDTYYNTTK